MFVLCITLHAVYTTKPKISDNIHILAEYADCGMKHRTHTDIKLEGHVPLTDLGLTVF